jgi:hypothetical protein
MEGAPSKHGHEGAPSPRGEPPRWLRIGSLGWKGMIAIFSAIPIIAGGIAVTAKLFSGPEPPAVVRAHMSGVSLDFLGRLQCPQPHAVRGGANAGRGQHRSGDTRETSKLHRRAVP